MGHIGALICTGPVEFKRNLRNGEQFLRVVAPANWFEAISLNIPATSLCTARGKGTMKINFIYSTQVAEDNFVRGTNRY
jgi:hypothetical protein